MHGLVRRLVAVAIVAAGVAPAAALAQRVVREGDAIVFEGRVDERSAAAFLALAREPGIARLVITSGGGLVAPAIDMAEAIHARGLDIEVPVQCLSSCANYLFPAARRKRIGGPGAVAWHGNMAHVLHLADTGEEHWGEEALRQARDLAVREAALYRRLGVDGFACWFGKLAPFSVDGFYALAPAAMQGFGIGDVTVLDPSAPVPASVVLLQPGPGTVDAIRPPRAGR